MFSLGFRNCPGPLINGLISLARPQERLGEKARVAESRRGKPLAAESACLRRRRSLPSVGPASTLAWRRIVLSAVPEAPGRAAMKDLFKQAQ